MSIHLHFDPFFHRSSTCELLIALEAQAPEAPEVSGYKFVGWDIADYEKVREVLSRRIAELELKLKTEELRSMEREKLTRRIECLRQERYELLLSIIEMRGRGGDA